MRPQTINKRIYQNVNNNLTQNPQIFSYPALVTIITTTNETSGDGHHHQQPWFHAFTVVVSRAGGHYQVGTMKPQGAMSSHRPQPNLDRADMLVIRNL